MFIYSVENCIVIHCFYIFYNLSLLQNISKLIFCIWNINWAGGPEMLTFFFLLYHKMNNYQKVSKIQFTTIDFLVTRY